MLLVQGVAKFLYANFKAIPQNIYEIKLKLQLFS